MEMQIKHFSHKHRLIHKESRKERNQRICKLCDIMSTDYPTDFYGCERCDYYLCKSCAELPRKIQHPFHKEHLLTLLPTSPYDIDAGIAKKILFEGIFDNDDDSDSHSADESTDGYYCGACMLIMGGSLYHCTECHFDLHIDCAMLMPITKEEEELQMMNITHPHPLIPCHRKKETDSECSVCEISINNEMGTIYVCLECKTIMDKSCAQLPLQITHHFHPHHSLTLKPRTNGSPFPDCKACGHGQIRFSYSCSECEEFHLDIKCASLQQQQEELNVFTHAHVLIPSVISNSNFNFSCSACEISFKKGTTVYVCLQCHHFLHKSCAELPREIRHHFHPPHPLVLRDSQVNFTCKACHRERESYNYWCAKCDFEMDTICASLSSTVEFKIHRHPLAFFKKRDNIRIFSLQCSADDHHAVWSGEVHDLSFPYFRCVPCNFNLDLFCLPTLPHTFKHSNHRHSLTLTNSPIKDNSDDDFYSEYYCDLCEELRELQEPTYFCEECHYVAEVSCVFNEVLPLLEREWSLAQEEIAMLQAEVNALIAKLNTLTTKLDVLKKRRVQHFDDYQIGVMKVESKNASTDQKEFLSTARDDPAIAKVDEEIIMLEAEVDALTVNLVTLTTKFDEFKGRHAQHIHDYQIEVTDAEARNALTDQKTLLKAASDHSSIAKPDENFVSLQAKVDALTVELEKVTRKLDEFKGRHPQHIVEEDCSVKRTKKEDEEEESDGTCSTLADQDEEDEEEESDGTCSTLADQDEEAITSKLEALKKKHDEEMEALKKKHDEEIEALTAKLEALKKSL